jgi:outer membrane biosynthesis protein TonB
MKNIILATLLSLPFMAISQTDSLSINPNDSTEIEWISDRYHSFDHYMSSLVGYPIELLKREIYINGRVRFRYKINPDWTISDIQILESPHDFFSKEIINTIKQMPKYWKPARMNGENVSYNYEGEIIFKIGD